MYKAMKPDCLPQRLESDLERPYGETRHIFTSKYVNPLALESTLELKKKFNHFYHFFFQFGFHDSQREEELLSSWWKEYAECSEGPSGWPTTSKKIDTQENADSPVGGRAAQLHEVEEERVGVPVKGGLYEVCKALCFHGSFNYEISNLILNISVAPSVFLSSTS